MTSNNSDKKPERQYNDTEEIEKETEREVVVMVLEEIRKKINEGKELKAEAVQEVEAGQETVETAVESLAESEAKPLVEEATTAGQEYIEKNDDAIEEYTIMQKEVMDDKERKLLELRDKQQEVLAQWKKEGADDIDSEHQQKMAWHAVYNKDAEADIRSEADQKRQGWAKADNSEQNDYKIDTDQFTLQTGEAVRQIVDKQLKMIAEISRNISKNEKETEKNQTGKEQKIETKDKTKSKTAEVGQYPDSDEYTTEAGFHGWTEEDIDSANKENQENNSYEDYLLSKIGEYKQENEAREKGKKSENETAENIEERLNIARSRYYEARRQRMKWVGGGKYRQGIWTPQESELMKKIRTEYEDALAKNIQQKAQADFKEMDFSELIYEDERKKAEAEWLSTRYIEEQDKENKKVWQTEFVESKREWGKKFVDGWRRQRVLRMGIGAGLLGASFIPGMAAVTLPIRLGLRSVGTAIGLEGVMAKWGPLKEKKGLADKLYKAHRKEIKAGDLAGLKAELADCRPDQINEEMQRLNALAERKSLKAGDMDAGAYLGDLDGGKMKKVIEAIYQAHLTGLRAKLMESGNEEDKENKEGNKNDKIVDGLTGILEKMHLGEEAIGQHERRREMGRWVTASAIGIGVAVLPNINKLKGLFDGPPDVAKAVPVEVGPDVAATTPEVTVEAIPEAVIGEVPEITPPLEVASLADEARNAIENADASGARSVWGVIDMKCEAAINNLSSIDAVDRVSGSDGKITYVLDSIKDKIAEDPDSFGLPADIDRVSPEDLIRLAKNDKLNSLVLDSFVNNSGEAAETLTQAADLGQEAVANIEANNAFYEGVASAVKESGVTLDQSAYNAMTQARQSGLGVSETAEILKGGSKSSVDLIEFYSNHPDVPRVESLSKIVSAYGEEVANKVVEATGGNIGPATQSVLENTNLLSNFDSPQAGAWLKLAHHYDADEITTLGKGDVAVKKLFQVAKVGDIVDTNHIAVSGNAVEVGAEDLAVKINFADQTIEASSRPKGIFGALKQIEKYSGNFKGKDPSKVLADVVDHIK